jgi:hypothetical protein
MTDTKKRPAPKTPAAHSLPQASHPAVVHPDHEWRSPSGRLHPQADTSKEPTEIAIVARGHTVHAPIAGEFIRAGFDKDTGRPVQAAAQKTYRPGDQIELPVSEIARFKKLGFLVDDSKATPPRHGNGAAA